LPLLPLLPVSIAKASATHNWTFEATYRIQLLSLHLATFPPPATLAAGFGYGRLTILTRRASHPLDGEPYPGSRLSCWTLSGSELKSLTKRHSCPDRNRMALS
jgi:hypothetical protein